ncbi:MAG: hypothetical protein J0M04_22950 [Verrucomicrobia bacterium]|nr:hypothetical protein [Verrucomicrobiota bacterium]
MKLPYFHPLCVCFLLAPMAPAQSALPEPPVILYGQVSPASPTADLSTVSFTLTGNSETLTTTAPAQVVTVNGQGFFLVRIPFETRVVQGGSPRTPTPGTLALTTSDTPYTLSAQVGAQTATLPAGKTTLLYSAQRHGLIDRIDLTLGGETYEQWSQRIFGNLVSGSADADGDGRGNHDEYLAGTNPQDASSRFLVKNFAPAPGGGFTLTWDTVTGKTYRIERATSLAPDQWTPLQINIQGDGTSKTFTDANPGSAPCVFYRIAVIQE